MQICGEYISLQPMSQSIPWKYIARLGAGVLFAAAGDYIRRKNILTLGLLRKIFMLFCEYLIIHFVYRFLL